jgi:phosphoribosylamine--glycine ligase
MIGRHSAAPKQAAIPGLALPAAAGHHQGMRILIVGSGGREHALAWRLSQSPMVTALIAAPGNPGIAQHATCHAIAADDIAGLVRLAQTRAVTLVVVGPEAPLAAGLVDALAQIGIAAFGPTRAAAQLETSKAFTKDFCTRHAIPTAAYAVFEDAVRAKAYLGGREPPFVIKADGLAQGKGVVIAQTRREADEAIDHALFLGKFSSAGARIVIEDFLPGEEISLFAVCDGQRAVFLGAAQDHKRAYDGDTGPNTGGMGAYSPAPAASPAVIEAAMAEIITPTLTGMAAEGAPFRGVLFAGLMVSSTGPKLIEFNTRFGDPECQTLMRLMVSDLAPLLAAAAHGDLSQAGAIQMAPGAAMTIVMAAQGYPDAPLTGSLIRGLAGADSQAGVKIFSAGVRQDEDGALRAAGGRVLNVTAVGATLAEAADRAYAATAMIDWPGGFYRRDIGWRALSQS